MKTHNTKLALAGLVVGVAVLSSTLLIAQSDDAADAGGFEKSMLLDEANVSSRIESLRAEATPEQARYFDDGSISLDEYEQAVAGSVDCLERWVSEEAVEAASLSERPRLEVSDLKVSGDQFQIAYTYSVTSVAEADQTTENLQRLTDADRDCQATYQHAVESAYKLTVLSDTDFVSRASGSFFACLTSSGVSAAGMTDMSPTDAFLQLRKDAAAKQRTMTCVDETPSIASAIGQERS
jgi:hypothetical protein